MSILEIDWNQKRPLDEEILDVLKTLTLKPVNISNDSIQDLLNAFKNSYRNGKVNMVCLEIPENNILDWFLSRNRSEEYNIIHWLLQQAWGLPLQNEREVSEKYGSGIKMVWGSPFTLSGQIAQSLFQGGAYSGYKGSGADALKISENFRKAIFDDRFNEIFVFFITGPWTKWFHGVAWDYTWFILDKRNRLIWLLSVTDMD